jgi:bifunctional non-homologous end joining protein LigD
VLFPDDGITKGELAAYYEAIAPPILPHIVNRPLTIVRCPKGLPGKCFYQRHINESLPSALRGVNVREGDEVVRYIVIDDLQGLISLIQLSTLEIHPWGSTADDVEHPNRLIFDLDPAPGVVWKRVVEAAMTVRDILAAANLTSFVQTSGGKGLHVIVPIVPQANWGQAKAFCQAVAQLIASREPKKYTAILSKSKREGKIFIDYLRNGRGATSVASYSSRARPSASVATPLSWLELSRIRSADVFTVKNLQKRLKSLKGDPWAGYFLIRQQLPQLSPK